MCVSGFGHVKTDLMRQRRNNSTVVRVSHGFTSGWTRNGELDTYCFKQCVLRRPSLAKAPGMFSSGDPSRSRANNCALRFSVVSELTASGSSEESSSCSVISASM